VFIAAAAVADWRVEDVEHAKLKKGAGDPPTLSLVENPDILGQIARVGAKRPSIVVGFAAETEDVVENAKRKLSRKGCDVIVANSVAEGSGVFGGADNQVHIVTPAGAEPWPRMSKAEVAAGLVELIGQRLGKRR
jgi:phosphopantothenoylcysteine decarboxylase/phosphopantothenate--cysteine ligase